MPDKPNVLILNDIGCMPIDELTEYARKMYIENEMLKSIQSDNNNGYRVVMDELTLTSPHSTVPQPR